MLRKEVLPISQLIQQSHRQTQGMTDTHTTSDGARGGQNGLFPLLNILVLKITLHQIFHSQKKKVIMMVMMRKILQSEVSTP
jgi:hypothetical protein